MLIYMRNSPETRPNLFGRIAEGARRLVGRNIEQNPARKAARKILRDCGEIASYFKDSFEEVHWENASNFYLGLLLDTALHEAVFFTSYDEHSLSLSKEVFDETSRLFEEKRVEIYNRVTTDFGIKNPRILESLDYFYQTQVLPEAEKICRFYVIMRESKKHGVPREKIAAAVDDALWVLIPGMKGLEKQARESKNSHKKI